MPNLKLFNKRRTSAGNVLEIQPENTAPAQSSFRVLERPDKSASPSYGRQNGKLNHGRPWQSQLRGKSVEDLGPNRSVDTATSLHPVWALKRDRGSGGTTNSGSSGYYDSSAASARHSSSSTLPSSLEQEREPDEDELFPRKAATTPMYQPAPTGADEPLPQPPTFSSRAARAFSFGQKHNRTNSVPQEAPPTPKKSVNGSPNRSESPQRDRSMTASSYASTAVPTKPQTNLSLGETNFGDDFGNMFAGIGKSAAQSREELPLPPLPPAGGFHRTESEPMFPPRTLSRQTFTPPNAFRNARDEAASPYSYDGRESHDGLMPNSALSSPGFEDGPPVPSHSNGIAPAFLGRSKAGYSIVPERNPSPGLERSSSDNELGYSTEESKEQDQGYGNRQSHLDDGDRWTKRVELRDPQHPSASKSAPKQWPQNPQGQANASATRLGAVSPGSEEGASLFSSESKMTTPRATTLSTNGFQDESLFDHSPSGPPSRAIRPGANHTRTESGTPKRMTKAQFEALQRSTDNSPEHTEDDGHLEDDVEDDDDVERAKQLTRQRRKQEANMAVYRQQMKKVTGGGPADLPSAMRPSIGHSATAPPAAGMSLHLGGTGGTPPNESIRGKQAEDDDEDVPLGILQAHGFPSGGRPPTRVGDADGQRRASVAGSVLGGGAGQGNLPPFARRLPADPYFGSSLVNPANRESLAFSSAQSNFGGAQSVYGGSPGMPQMGHPGGLVGVIAGEERAKAARRGSPNPMTGTYNQPMPLPPGMPGAMPGMGMPGMPRTMSMGNVVAPQVYTPSGYMPGMPPMPQMPMMMPQQDQTQQQMQQFMQMQMQFMQNMMAMQQQTLGQTPPPMQQQPQDYLSVPLAGQRPMSMASQAPSFQNGLANQGRAMTMMTPPTRWDFQQGSQRPTSAMPGTYAPSVNGLNGGGPGPGYTPSIAPSERSNVGLASRYRPVATNGDAATGRSQSMNSSITLNAFTNQQGGQTPARPESRTGPLKSTIRIIDKPKGTPRVTTRNVDGDEDEDEGWADMAKKRKEKKFSWRKKDNSQAEAEAALQEIYKGLE